MLKRHLWIALAAVLLVLPLFLLPPQVRDSWPVNVNWIIQFTDQLVAGHAYPRWLPESHGGSGAPAFYFYAPLPFYVGAVPRLMGAAPYAATVITFAIGLYAMGAAMLQFLARARQPLLGAIAYMVMPYTLFDLYWRAAIGEIFAMVFIPLVMLAMRDRRVVLLAFAYAGLLYSHLPLALLASLFLFAPYGLYLMIRDRSVALALPFAAGSGAGLLMAGLYLVPALTLQDYISMGWLHGADHTTPANWLLLSDWAMDNEFAIIMFAVAALTFASALLLWRGQKLFASYALAILFVVTLGYGLWSIPLLTKVQFPFRAFPLAGFALAAAFAWSNDRLFRTAALLPIAAGGLAAVTALETDPAPISKWLDRHLEVPEYLPPTAPSQEGPRLALWAAEQEGIFYFPSLGTSTDGLFLDGEPELRMLDEEKIGLALSLLGLAMTLALWRARRRVRLLAPAPATAPV